MTTRKEDVKHKEIRAWGIRREEVDITQLAFAYYLLAKRRIEQQREVGQKRRGGADEEAA